MTHRSTCVCSKCPGGRYEAERHERAYSLLGIVPGGETRVLDGLRHVAGLVRVLQWRQTVQEPSWSEVAKAVTAAATSGPGHHASRYELDAFPGAAAVEAAPGLVVRESLDPIPEVHAA